MKKAFVRDREKKKRKLVWIDLFIIFLVLSVGFFGARYLYRRYRATASTEKVRYTVCISEVPTLLLEENGGLEGVIPIGCTVTSENGTTKLGKVSSISSRPHFVLVVSEETVDFAEHPEKLDLVVSVYGEAVLKEGDGIRINDIRIAAGERGDYRFGSFYAAGATVISVVKEENT